MEDIRQKLVGTLPWRRGHSVNEGIPIFDKHGDLVFMLKGPYSDVDEAIGDILIEALALRAEQKLNRPDEPDDGCDRRGVVHEHG